MKTLIAWFTHNQIKDYEKGGPRGDGDPLRRDTKFSTVTMNCEKQANLANDCWKSGGVASWLGNT